MMLGLVLGVLFLIVSILFIFRRPTIARAGFGYARDRMRWTGLIIVGLSIGSGVVAAVGIAGDSVAESFRDELVKQSGPVDGILDAGRLGLDPEFPQTRESAERLISHPTLNGLVASHSVGLRLEMPVGATASAGEEMAVWGVDHQTFPQLMAWQPLDGFLPAQWSRGDVVVNERAAERLGLRPQDSAFLILDTVPQVGSRDERQSWNETGHLRIASYDPTSASYVHASQDQYAFAFRIEEPVIPSTFLRTGSIHFNATTTAPFDLHLEVRGPEGFTGWDRSAGPNASVGASAMAGIWEVAVHSPLAVEAPLWLNATATWYLDEVETVLPTQELVVQAVVPTRGSDPLQDGPAVFMALTTLQDVIARPFLVNVVLVDAPEGTDPGLLESSLQTAESATWGGAAEVHVPAVDENIDILQEDMTQLVLLFSTFTIASSLLLIFVIVALLVEDRKRTLATLRAIGTQRKDLVRMHMAEGLLYGACAAIAGVVVGVLIILALAQPMAVYSGLSAGSLRITLDAWTLANAIGGALAITLGAMTFAVDRSARLDIPMALRGEEPRMPPRSWRALHWPIALLTIGCATLLVGLLTGQAAVSFLGWAIGLAGLTPLLVRVVGRHRGMLAGLAALALIGGAHFPLVNLEEAQGALLLPLSAAAFSFGAVGVVLYATPLHNLLWKVSHKIRLSGEALEVALAHVRERPGRATLIGGMLASILLATSVFLSLGGAVAAPSLGDGTGYSIIGNTAADIPDVDAHLARFPPRGGHDLASLAESISSTPWLEGGDFSPGWADGSIDSPLQTTVPGWLDHVIAVTPGFIAGAPSDAGGSAGGATDIRRAFEEVARNPSAVVIAAHMGASEDTARTPKAGDRIISRSHSTSTGERLELTVVAVAENDGAAGLYVHPDVLALFPNVGTRIWAQPASGVSDTQLAVELERAFRSVALDIILINDPYPAVKARADGLQALIGTFVGIGLLVGIVGLALLTFRNVVVRRKEIGTFRALGVTPQQVVSMFLWETLYVMAAVVFVGAVGSAIMVRVILAKEATLSSSSLDWGAVAILNGALVLTAVGMGWIASRQAARQDPITALQSPG